MTMEKSFDGQNGNGAVMPNGPPAQDAGHCSSTTSFYIFSEAGKPIFSYTIGNGNDNHEYNYKDTPTASSYSHQQQDPAEVARICGLFAALRGSLLYNRELQGGRKVEGQELGGEGQEGQQQYQQQQQQQQPLGDIQCIQCCSGDDCNNDDNDDDDDSSATMTIVFLHVHAISLVAVHQNQNHNTNNNTNNIMTETFLRLQLEYLYEQLLFQWSDQVQVALQHNSSLDLAEMMVTDQQSSDSSDNQNNQQSDAAWNLAAWLQTWLKEQQLFHPQPFNRSPQPQQRNNHQHTSSLPFWLFCGTPLLAPIQPATRRHVSRALAGISSPHTVFALLMTTETTATAIRTTTTTKTALNNSDSTKSQLISLVQPDYRPHLMRPSDLNLLLHYIATRCLASSESLRTPEQAATATTSTSNLQQQQWWFPLCLPRFHASGFLYCFVQCLNTKQNINSDNNESLALVLLSQNGGPEQLQAFQTAARQVASELDIPMEPNEQQEQPSPSKQDAQSINNDNDDDYVDAAGEGDQLIPYLTCPLLDEVASISSNERQFFLDLLPPHNDDPNHMVHFCFRFNAAVREATPSKPGWKSPFQNNNNNKPAKMIGHLPQCLSSPILLDDDDGKNIRTAFLWSMYQRLSLRLRLGSATDEAVHDALAMVKEHAQSEHDTHPGIGRDLPATALMESAPSLCNNKNNDGSTTTSNGSGGGGMVYEHCDNMTFFAMTGEDFELYMCSTTTTTSETVHPSAAAAQQPSIKSVAKLGAKLARRLLLDRERLFLTDPPTWQPM